MQSKYGQSARSQLIQRLSQVRASNQFPDQNTKGIRVSRGRGMALKGLKKVKLNKKAIRGSGSSGGSSGGGGSAWINEVKAIQKKHPGITYGQAMSMAKAARCERLLKKKGGVINEHVGPKRGGVINEHVGPKRGGVINEHVGPKRGGAINEPWGPSRGGMIRDARGSSELLRDQLMSAYRGSGRSGGVLMDQLNNIHRGGALEDKPMYWPQDARPLYGGGNEVSALPVDEYLPDDARKFYGTGGVLDGEIASAYMLGGQLVDSYHNYNDDQSKATSYNDYRITYPDYSDRPLNNFEGFPRRLIETSKRNNEYYDRPDYEELKGQPPYRPKDIPFPTYLK